MFENPSLNSIRDGNFLPRYFTEIYYFMLFVGVIGNVITCTVIIKNKFMHTATNYYLLNLAVTDLVILIFAVPCNILIPLKSDLHCQLIQLIVRTSMNISVLNVTVLSVERYVGICHPFIASKYTLSSKSRALKIITAIWLIGFLCALPGSLQLRLVPSVNDPTVGACHYVTEVGLYLEGIRSALFFVIPMLIIATTYFLIILSLKSSDKVVRNNNDITERSKRRIPKLLMAVIGAFWVCWMPTTLSRVLLMFQFDYHSLSDSTLDFIVYVFTVCDFLFYLSSLINPILYNMMSQKFRDAFKITVSSFCNDGTPSNRIVMN